MLDEKLIRGITAYAIDDYLRYKLGKRLIGAMESDEFEHFADAVCYLAKKPRIRKLLGRLTTEQMIRLLETLEDAIG